MNGAAPVTRSIEVLTGTHDYSVDLVLDFDPIAGSLQVLVEDGEGKALDGYRVELWPEGGQSRVAYYYSRGSEGADELSQIPVGDYKVRASFEGFSEGGLPNAAYFHADGFAAIERDQLTTLRLKTTSAGRLKIRMLDPHETEGQVEVSLSLQSDRGTVHLNHLLMPSENGVGIDGISLGSEGYTEMQRAGSYILRAEAEGYRTHEVSVDLAGGEVREIEILLERE